MNPEKEKLLNETYNTFMDLMLGDLPLNSVNDLVVEDVTGYGSTVDEKINDISRLRQLVIDQREQGVGIEISVDRKPVHRRISPEEDTAIIIDEIEVTIQGDEGKNILNLRLSLIFEFIKGRWKVVHMHGSTGVETEGDTWHMDEWEKKMEELQRLVDEKTAELQNKNRELEIEAALEKVRSRSLAMHKSDELQDVVNTVFERFKDLKIDMNVASIFIFKEGSKDWEQWVASSTTSYSTYFHIPYTDNLVFRDLEKAKQKGKDFYSVRYTFDQKNEWFSYAFKNTEYRQIANDRKKYILKSKFFLVSFALSKHSGIQIAKYEGKDFSQEENEILKRFSRVFEQAYVRFLDLQKAEAQAREAQIEASLERVRSRAMSMQNSDELAELVSTVFKELTQLDFLLTSCIIWIHNTIKSTEELWMASPDMDKPPQPYIIHSFRHPYFRSIVRAWKKKDKTWIYSMGGKEKEEFQQQFFDAAAILPEELKKSMMEPEDVVFSASFSNFGALEIVGTQALSEKKLNILHRFGGVLDLSYTRFLDLHNAEEQNKIIKADNDRKSLELEEARQLQLAMLPKEIPKFPNIDIEVYMQTATEVGGDYYDFSVRDDGSINIAIGDATGHGMKAGTLVTMIKSLFVANSSGKDIEDFFLSSNAAIKNSNLKKMMVGFAMLNIKDHKAKLINAAMPPVYHIKKNDSKIEELKQHNLPLGAMKLVKYNSTEINLTKGDVLIMMSDGFPELHNPSDELFGYEKVYSSFEKVGEKEPVEIIRYLNEEAARWMEGKELQDDVTFVVIKIK